MEDILQCSEICTLTPLIAWSTCTWNWCHIWPFAVFVGRINETRLLAIEEIVCYGLLSYIFGFHMSADTRHACKNKAHNAANTKSHKEATLFDTDEQAWLGGRWHLSCSLIGIFICQTLILKNWGRIRKIWAPHCEWIRWIGKTISYSCQVFSASTLGWIGFFSTQSCNSHTRGYRWRSFSKSLVKKELAGDHRWSWVLPLGTRFAMKVMQLTHGWRPALRREFRLGGQVGGSYRRGGGGSYRRLKGSIRGWGRAQPRDKRTKIRVSKVC